MNKPIRFLLLAAVVAMCLGAPSAASAQSPWPPFCKEDSLPSHDPQYPADQLILTCIPPGWNGQLVMYAHGYVAAQMPLALPYEELYLSGGMVEAVLGKGYAFATTSYPKNGYAVEQARRDLNDLLNHFKKLVPPGSLQKTYLVGASEGGEITALMIERFPDKYAGGPGDVRPDRRRALQPVDETNFTASWVGTSTLWVSTAVPLGLVKMENAYHSKLTKEDDGMRIKETWVLTEFGFKNWPEE